MTMKFEFKCKFVIVLSLLVLFLSISGVSALDNITDVVVQEDADALENNDIDNIDARIDNVVEIKNTSINSNSPSVYYKEKGQLVTYLKDSGGHPVSNKNLTILLNGKSYTRTTDNTGKAVLNLNLKPNKYDVKIKFNGDSNYSSSNYGGVVKVLKTPLSIKSNDFSTYWKSGLFFKTKVFNKITKNPVSGIKVLFKVYYSNKLYKKFHAITDAKGFAYLKKNLNVGTYKVQVSIDDKKQSEYFINKYSKDKVTMNVKKSIGIGCCSVYLQVGSSESVTSFRRDSTYAVDIHIKPVKWYGRTAIKQYKNDGGYAFHSITTSDGWTMGFGSADSAYANREIEKLAGQMVKAGSIKKSKLNSIRNHIASIGYSIGHFVIKAPDGKYSIVWVSGIKNGKLKAGQYICVPNSKSYFRQGKYTSFNTNPVKAAVKIVATDYYGVNRRNIFVHHWKATTKDGSTTSLVKSYVANDNGRYVDAGTGYLKDNVYYKNTFLSKNKLPVIPKTKYLGYYNFGKINKFKIQTTVSAPEITAFVNKSKLFKVTIKNKATKKLLNGVTIKLKVFTGSKYKIYSLKSTNGVIKLNTTKLSVGNHKVVVFSGNTKYYVSKVSKIVVKE